MAFTDQERRDYQKKYYKAHRAKALAYQREYTKRWKKAHPKDGRATKKIHPDQGIPKRCLSLADLSHSPTARFEKQIKMILSGQIGFTI